MTILACLSSTRPSFKRDFDAEIFKQFVAARVDSKWGNHVIMIVIHGVRKSG
jgi:hypothetical protein